MPSTFRVIAEGLDELEDLQDYPAQLLSAAYEDIEDDVEALFKKTWRNWSDKPDIQTVGRGGGVNVELSGDRAAIWDTIDKGRKDFKIVAKNVPNMVFRHGSGYTAGSSPGTLETGTASDTGPWVKKPEVNHSIAPRHWTQEIEKKAQALYEDAARKRARSPINVIKRLGQKFKRFFGGS